MPDSHRSWNWILGFSGASQFRIPNSEFWILYSGTLGQFPVWLSAREILFSQRQTQTEAETEPERRGLNKKIKTLIIINCFFFLSARPFWILNNNIFGFFFSPCVFLLYLMPFWLLFHLVLCARIFSHLVREIISGGDPFPPSILFGHNVAVAVVAVSLSCLPSYSNFLCVRLKPLKAISLWVSALPFGQD